MDEVQAGIRDWLDELERSNDPDNPLARALDEAADRLLAEAKALAPVSLTGSRYAPPGFLKERTIKADKEHDDDGLLARFVGTRTNRHAGANPYPYAFVANRAGSVWNRGHKSKRTAANYFLQIAEETVPFTTERVWP